MSAPLVRDLPAPAVPPSAQPSTAATGSAAPLLDIATVRAELSRDDAKVKVLDLAGRFDQPAIAKMRARAEALAEAAGGRVWVASVPGREDLESYATLHTDLRLQPRDVLLVFNTNHRRLNCAAVPKTEANAVLASTRDFYNEPVTGVIHMLDELQKRLVTTQTPQPSVEAPAAPRGWSPPAFLVDSIFLSLGAIVALALLVVTSRRGNAASSSVRSTPAGHRADEGRRPSESSSA